MLANYFKVAIRNLLKNKMHSLINIFGLAIGLAASMLIVLYVIHERSYDQFHEQAENIFRVVQTMGSADRSEDQASTPFPLAPILEAEFPDRVAKTVRFFNMQEPTHTFLNREKEISFRESNFYFVDSTFFDVFSAELLRGNPDEALKNPQSLVITEELAIKYFGDENPIGQTLSYRGISDMAVTGVMKSWPENSHMNIDLIASFSSLNDIYSNSPDYDHSWFWNPLWTYILLEEGSSKNELEFQLSTLKEKYYYAYPGWPSDESIELELQPVTDIHLYSNRDQEMKPNSSALYMNILIAVAGFILLIACINFMNLSTARSLERSREVGLRKVLGGYKKQLFLQFIGESVLITFLAISIGVLIVVSALPDFNELVDKSLSFHLFQNLLVIPLLLLITLVVGIFAGSYPALFLSSFEPVKVLKGSSSNGRNDARFRKILVTFQFSLSAILIIGTAVIFLQLQYIQKKDLGFNKENVLLLPTKQNLIAFEFDNFVERAQNHSQIISVTGLGKIPGSEQQEYYRYVPAKQGEGKDGMNLVLYVTHDVTKTFDLTILAGRPFSRDFPSDHENAVLINRKMLSQLDIESPEDALGEIFYYYPPYGDRASFSVVGVLEDFNYTSLKKEIEPLILKLVETPRYILGSIEHTAVKVAPGNPSAAISHLEEVWNEINYVDPFEYRFLDERLADIYEAETTMSVLATAFTILCIIIACLGLLGLTSYSAQLKKREIGIRKSLGASLANIVGLLSKDFLLLIILANIIAWPLTYFMAVNWLANFPYRFDLFSNLPFLFIGSSLLILIIALATVSYHSVKAAHVNPVEAIRNE